MTLEPCISSVLMNASDCATLNVDCSLVEDLQCVYSSPPRLANTLFMSSSLSYLVRLLRRVKRRALLLSLRALVPYACEAARWKRRKDIVIATHFRRCVLLLKATLALRQSLDKRAFIPVRSLRVQMSYYDDNGVLVFTVVISVIAIVVKMACIWCCVMKLIFCL